MIRGTPEERRETVARALELGINYFDTAPGYGNSVSEANLGRTLRELGARPVIATKVGLSAEDVGDIAGAVVRSVEASLARLNVSKIPLIQMHNRVGRARAPKADLGGAALLSVDDVLGPAGVVAAFKSLRSRGLVDFFGCSSFGGEMPAVERLIDSGEFDAIIVNYSMLNTSAWTRPITLLPLRNYAGVGARAVAAGMAAIALRVLEGGTVVTEAAPSASGEVRVVPEFQALQERARDMRRRVGHGEAALTQTAIRFALSNPEISCALIGFSNTGQVEDAVRYASLGPLSPDVLSLISPPSGRISERAP
jgi:aryl-alcohol dehydrogenase-like predicted oxidoreductase